MFHPLYYKMFQCTRKYCKAAPYCPFYHAEQEKKIWGDYFLTFINKERVSYVKERKRSSISTEDSSLSPKAENMQKSPKSDYFKSPRAEFLKSPRAEFTKSPRQEYFRSQKYEMARKVFDKYTKYGNNANGMMNNNNNNDGNNGRYERYDLTNVCDRYETSERYEESEEFVSFAGKNGNRRQVFANKRVSKEIRVN